jgi:hypothetical protein
MESRIIVGPHPVIAGLYFVLKIKIEKHISAAIGSTAGAGLRARCSM